MRCFYYLSCLKNYRFLAPFLHSISEILIKTVGVKRDLSAKTEKLGPIKQYLFTSPKQYYQRSPVSCYRELCKFHPSWYGPLPLFIPILFHWSSSYQLYRIENKRNEVHFGSCGNRRQRFFHYIKQRNQNFLCFYLLHRYSLLRTLLSLPWRFYIINAAWCPWPRRVIYSFFSNVAAIWPTFHIFSLTPF